MTVNDVHHAEIDRQLFDKSLSELEARADDVPPGWRRPYYAALGALRAVRCDGRAAVRLIGPSFGAVNVTILHNGLDPVINGITNRLERATACTCEACGRPGRLRSFSPLRVLCATCATPLLLRDELRRLLQDLDRRERAKLHGAISLDELPVVLRPVMPAAAVREVRSSKREQQCSFVLSETLLEYRSWFETVLQQAEADAPDGWREPEAADG